MHAYRQAASGEIDAYGDALTSFDGNGRAIEQTDFDGTITHTIYDPMTGQVASTWSDNNEDGDFDSGVDSKSISKPTALATDASTAAGETDDDLSADGVEADSSSTWNGGLNSSDTV